MNVPITITGYSKEEVQKKVDEHIKRNSNLRVKVSPMIVKDGRLMVSTKWIAVLVKKDLINP